jgi:hypothetical protein
MTNIDVEFVKVNMEVLKKQVNFLNEMLTKNYTNYNSSFAKTLVVGIQDTIVDLHRSVVEVQARNANDNLIKGIENELSKT